VRVDSQQEARENAMGVKPRLLDLKCAALRFNPGDRIIVRTPHLLDEDQRRKIRRMITKWAGVDVEVLIVELPLFDVEIDRK
jgi:hypothetical protein